MTGRPPTPPAAEAQSPEPGAWVRLIEGPFEGLWIGLSQDFAELLPCEPIDQAHVRLWICLTDPAASALASQLLEARRAGRIHRSSPRSPSGGD